MAKYISSKHLHTIFGVIVAFFVLTQAVIVERKAERKSDKQEQKHSEESDSQQITENIAIASASPQISLDYQSYFLGEIFIKDQEEKDRTNRKEVLLSAPKAIKVILRRIISPNAP